MKTKTLFFAALLSLLVASESTAQQAYYTTGTISREGYTYKCISENGGITTLYNAENQFTDVEWARKDGKPIEDGILLGRIRTAEPGNNPTTIWNIVYNSFTEAERQSFDDERLAIHLKVNSTTGHVLDVTFSFMTWAKYINIPIEKYRQIELEIKKNIVPTITNAGKQLNYCQFNTSFGLPQTKSRPQTRTHYRPTGAVATLDTTYFRSSPASTMD